VEWETEVQDVACEQVIMLLPIVPFYLSKENAATMPRVHVKQIVIKEAFLLDWVIPMT